MEQRQKKRISCFLKQQEQYSVYDFSEESPYTESILSKEIKMYFHESMLSAESEKDLDEGEVFLQKIYDLLPLDAFEQMCLELAVLGEVNSYFEKFYIYMNNDWNSGYLTLDTAVRMYTMEFDSNPLYYRYFFKESSPLRDFLSLDRQEGKGRGRWGLKCRECFLRLLFSGQAESCVAYPFIRYMDTGQTVEPLVYEASDIFFKLDMVTGKHPAGVYLYGKKGSGKLQIIGEYGRRKGHRVCFLDMKQLLFFSEKNFLDRDLEEICRDIRLLMLVENAWLCLDTLDGEYLEKEAALHFLERLLALFLNKGFVLFITGEQPLKLLKSRPDIWELSYECGEAERIQAWRKTASCYSLAEDVEVDLFANTYPFAPVQIKRIFEAAKRRSVLEHNDCIQREQLKAGCIEETQRDGNNHITVMNTGYTWEDLVLPDRQMEQLQSACNRIRYKHRVYGKWGFGEKLAYGRGVSMIFSGPPGTGKTMSAGIIADYLATTLYRVDLAAVVSKYIGETEKNLDSVFEAVSRGKGVLFFDEADVLFGRRTEAKSSNDKHSNMETAYLLQKMEIYEGVVILATNYMQNMDEAFKRRIQFVVEFPFPDENCRKKLWEKAFPEQLEFEEVPDYDFLAKHFELSGSHIKNIAVQAAFYAAHEEKGVNMKHIIKALRAEVRKTGKRISSEDLREYYIYFEQD